MPVVYLVRHGQASFGAADYDALSDLGLRQAGIVGDELRRRGATLEHAWCGTLARQRYTARAVAPAARADPRWNEYDHTDLVHRYAGAPAEVMQQASTQDFQRLLDNALLCWAEDPAGTWDAFRDGVRSALAEVTGSLGSGQDAVVFTSAGVIATACAALLDAPPATVVALNRAVVNGSITKVVHGRSGTTLAAFNDHGHFEGPNRSLLTYR